MNNNGEGRQIERIISFGGIYPEELKGNIIYARYEELGKEGILLDGRKVNRGRGKDVYIEAISNDVFGYKTRTISRNEIYEKGKKVDNLYKFREGYNLIPATEFLRAVTNMNNGKIVKRFEEDCSRLLSLFTITLRNSRNAKEQVEKMENLVFRSM